MQAGTGVARNRIGRRTRLRVADMILSGIHQPGDSQFELLQAFADGLLLKKLTASAKRNGYYTHEFGDSILLERQLFPPTLIDFAVPTSTRNHAC